jgi:hypothetical protein
MAKKKRATYVSKGERANIARSTVLAVRRDKPEASKWLDTLRAWKKGKNPKILDNGVKVKMNSVYGDPRKLVSQGAPVND